MEPNVAAVLLVVVVAAVFGMCEKWKTFGTSGTLGGSA